MRCLEPGHSGVLSKYLLVLGGNQKPEGIDVWSQTKFLAPPVCLTFLTQPIPPSLFSKLKHVFTSTRCDSE